MDGAGNVYIADTSNRRIRRVDAAGIITTVAGSGLQLFVGLGDGGPATEANLNLPAGVAPDGAGNLYIADTHYKRIRKVDTAGIITTIAGTGEFGYGGDGGPATEARLNFPGGVAVDGAGNLYIADTNNHRIRKVDVSGVITITTVAGNGEQGFSGDGGPATAALLNHPADVALDAAGNLYIADNGNSRIRKVNPAGIVTTIAGNGQFTGDLGDGGPAVEARLFFPYGVAADRAGNIYVADTFNQRVRILTPPPGNAPSISAGGVALANGTPLVKRISPNALVSVFGQDFAPEGAQARGPGLDAEGRVAANLAGVCLEIGGKRAPLFAVFSNQINAQVPHDLPPGQAAVEVVRGCGRSNEQRSATETVGVAVVAPAFFNLASNPDGRNPVAALHGGGPGLAGAPELGEAFTPAEPGEIVSLFGTGFGETEPRLEAGEIPGGQAGLANDVSFTFGGMAVPPEDVFYAGAAPCCAGLYQFAVRVPPDLPDGDAPVTATVQGVATPAGPFLSVRRR